MKVFEDVLEIESYDDGRQALICRIEDDRHPDLFIRVQSWDESCQHKELLALAGKKVRLTLEVLE